MSWNTPGQRRAKSLVALCAAIAVLTACSSSTSDEDGAESSADEPTRTVESAGELKIANFEAGTNNSYVQTRIDSAEETAAEIGADITLFDAGWDAIAQANQMETALTSGDFNAWLVQPVNAEPLCPLIEQAIAADIIVAVANSPVCGNETHMPGTVSFAGGLTEDTWNDWIEWIVDDAGAGEALVLTGPAELANTLNMNSSLETLTEGTDLNVAANQPTDYTAVGAYEIATNVLQTNSDLDVVITNWSESTQGVVEAANQLGRTADLRIYDMGGSAWALEAIADGTVIMTFPVLPALEARRSIEALAIFADTGETTGFIDLVNDETITDPFITADNVSEHEPYM